MHLTYHGCPNWTTAGCACPQPPIAQFGSPPFAPSVPHTFEPRPRPLVLVNAALHHSMQATHQLAALESENDKLREAVSDQQAALQATQTEHPDVYRPLCRAVLEKWRIEP